VARSTGSRRNIWARDISGDEDQDWNITKLGTVSESTNWPFTIENLDKVFNGYSVYEFYSDASGYCAVGTSSGISMSSSCGTGHEWVDDAGALYNVYESDQDGGAALCVYQVGLYDPLELQEACYGYTFVDP